MEEEYKYIGKRLPKVDVLEKVKGEAKYGVDIELPGMLHGKVLRSPFPHAKIFHIDTAGAERLPGVKAVVTAEDTPKIKFACFPLSYVEDEHVLAIDKVRFIGDEVAAVTAVDEETAEEALDLIKVEYEELPAVFDPEEAMKPDAPRIHEAEQNISSRFQYGRGDINKGFKEADHIFEDRFVTQYVHQCHLEPTVCVADFDAAGRLTFWLTSMAPSDIRLSIAKCLNIPESKIRVIQPYIGGAFGAKNPLPRLYPICALLARKAGKPVRMLNTREEEFVTTRPRLPMIIRLKTGVKKDGRLVAVHVKVTGDHGAYAGHSETIMSWTGLGVSSIYRISHFIDEGVGIYTNRGSVGAFRGYGYLQMMFAFESQMDMIAERLNIDPVELRLKNVVSEGEVTPVGWELKSLASRECLQKSTEYTKWKEKKLNKQANRGIGIASIIYLSDVQFIDFDGSHAFVKVLEDGRVQIISGETDYGQGAHTVFSQIAAEELGVPMEDVDISPKDSDLVPYALGPWGSRLTIGGGNAVRLAAIDARNQLFKIVADMWEANIMDLEVKEGKVRVKGSPEKEITFSEVVKAGLYSKGVSAIIGKGLDRRNTVLVEDMNVNANLSSAYTFATQVAEVEVDPETGKVKVLDFVTTCDIGKAINPMAVEGQFEGAVAQGLGFALMEEIMYDKGKVMNPNLLNYALPTMLDVPSVKTILAETIDPTGPYGGKGCAELSTIPVAAAIANAIYDAVGVRIKELPITPEKILKALRERKEE